LVLFILFLIIAAACAVLLLDPWAWLNEEENVAAEASAFPGVEEPSLLKPAEPIDSKPFNVLILGLDHGLERRDAGNSRSDVIMIAHIDEVNGRACLLSIPRDSYVEIPGHGKGKINDAYQLGGAELAVRTVEQVTGMDIRNYVALDFDEFIWLVDLFGGVQVTMEDTLNDPKLGYIPAGSQVLNGSQALILARSRAYPSGDLQRVREQQRLLIQILYKGKELAPYPGAAWFLTIAMRDLETDLTRDEVIRLAREFASFPVVDVQGGVASGKMTMIRGASVIVLDEAKLAELVISIETMGIIPQEYR
jgi:LCP family protein required for cell wall assembly